jgi:hypothetical protein
MGDLDATSNPNGVNDICVLLAFLIRKKTTVNRLVMGDMIYREKKKPNFTPQIRTH